MDERKRQNLAFWDAAVPIHLASEFYQADAFRRGEVVLDPIARERIGNVAGKRLLHMQCHFGLDTLSLARMGAAVTGLDFSRPAISTARALAHEARLPAEFVECDVTQPYVLLRDFDIVFASWGAICWIPDLRPWMIVAAKALKPGGRLLLMDGHPAMMMMDEQVPPVAPFVVRYPYQSPEPVVDESEVDYADPNARIKEKTYIWSHGIGEILAAAMAAGFEIRAFDEVDRVPWAALPQLVKRDKYYWSLPDDAPFMPLAFVLDAVRKPK